MFAPLSAAAAETPSSDTPVLRQKGKASYYGDAFEGRTTANGERFDPDKLTAASKTLPLGTKATVTNEENGRSVHVRINDRGPYVDGRIIDLSKKAAKKLHMEKQGVVPVTVEAHPSAQPTPEIEAKVREKAESRGK